MPNNSPPAPTGAHKTPKYPRTPYAPFSPSGITGRPPAHIAHFLGVDLIITEKLDGSNTRLHNSRAYPRSTADGNDHPRYPWLAMVRKHHAWKTANDPTTHLYGEDIYGLHSIRYDPVPEDRTFYLFATRTHVLWEPWDQVEAWAHIYRIPTVPVLHRGVFHSAQRLRDLCLELVRQPSALGPRREGVVIRTAQGFDPQSFPNAVCKVVRADHVQPDEEHWSRHWTPCRILPAP